MMAAVLGLLAIPVDLVFEGVAGGRWSMRIEWLFGAVGIDLGAPSPAMALSRPARQRPPLRKALSLARSPGFLRNLMRLVRRCIAAIEVRRLHLSVSFGLDDPADTGFVFALGQAVRATLPTGRANLRLDLHPDFIEPGLWGEGSAAVRARPLRLILEVLRFLIAVVGARVLDFAVAL
jgi:hypothetical protein